MTQRFSGHNELDAAFNAAMLTVVNTLALVTALGGSTAAWGLWVAGLVLTPVIYFGSRYRVSVGPSGVEVVRYHLWPLWRQKTTYFLDVGIDLYDTWDSDRAQGVYLRAAASAEADSDAFGPYWDAEAMSALVDRVSRAITEQRKAVGRPRGLRLDGFDASAFEVHDRSPGGPPLRLLSREALTVLGVSIPSGSRFALNRPGWVDPARTDAFDCIELSAATRLPNGVELAAGATLQYSTTRAERVTVSGAVGPDVRFGDITFSLARPVTFDADEGYALVEFTLARELWRGGVCLPVGTRVRPDWLDDGGRVAELPSATSLREDDPCSPRLYAGDRITFDGKWQPRSLSVERDRLVVNGVLLEGQLCLIPLKRGSVDIAECKKRGLVAA